jgi:hypothetical protein
VSKSTHAEQGERSLYQHYLQEFLTFSNKREGSPTPRLSTATVR